MTAGRVNLPLIPHQRHTEFQNLLVRWYSTCSVPSGVNSRPLSHHTHHKPLVKAKTINFPVTDRARRSRKIIQFWAQYSIV